MNARRLVLATVVSLCSLIAGASFAAPAALAEESCPNVASRQGPSAALPDCRVYEQVTARLDKSTLANDMFVHPQISTGMPSDSGNGFVLQLVSGLSGRSPYVFRRGSNGWSATSVGLSEAVVQSVRLKAIDPSNDFSAIGVSDEVGTRAGSFAAGPTQLMSLVGPPEGPFAVLSTDPITQEVPLKQYPEIVGGSAGLSHVVLESYDHKLTSEDFGQDSASRALYESVDGRLRLVNVADDGSLISRCGAVLGQGVRPIDGYAHNAVSRDGSRIVFTAPDPEAAGLGCWDHGTTNPPELFVRSEEPDGSMKTVDVSSHPEAGVADPTLYPAVYVGSSQDGSKVFFVTRTELTVDDKTNAPELYEYDAAAPEGKRIVRVSRGESGEAEGNVDFVPAVSSEEGEEGVSVYFTAFGQLTTGLPPLGARNAYLYRYATGTGRIAYVATVGGNEYPMWTYGEVASTIWYNKSAALPEEEEGRRSQELGLHAGANWYATANGRYLVFDSYQPLTGYDNTKAPGADCHNLTPGGSKPTVCGEVFRYDAATGDIACVSCGNVPASSVDNAEFAASYLFELPAGTPPRPVSEDGSYVFFQTANTLTPNAPPGKIHVYEWHNGAVSLISAPGDPGDAFFLGADPSGRDVFIGTHAQLSSHDEDTAGDLYDARVDGGFPAVTPSLCTGTGCQGVPSAPPLFATPASVTFGGIGNYNLGKKMPSRGELKRRRLISALRTCKRDRSRRRRHRCEALVRKRYGSAHVSAKIDRRGK